MENDVLDALKDVDYNMDDVELEKALAEGPKSVDYTKLVSWITKELKFLFELDEHVDEISSSADSSMFLMELSSFLKELGCQYTSLTTGHVNDRLQSRQNRLLLLDYLLTELKAARMFRANKPDTKDDLQVTLHESGTASELKNILMVLKFPKPPDNIPPATLFSKVENRLKDIVSKANPALVGKPMFEGQLTGKQWHSLLAVQQELHEEYKIRREMLLTRLDVTIRSFEWSDRLQSKTNDIETSYQMERKKMSTEPSVRLSHILAARKDLAVLERISSSSVRRKTKSDINTVIIGNVPDRGGRPYEQEPPPPEMPSWQQRSAQQKGGGGGGRRGAQRGRGGRGRGDSRSGGFEGGRGGGQQNTFGAGNVGMQQSSFEGGYSGNGGTRGNYESRVAPQASEYGSGRVQAGWNTGGYGYRQDRCDQGNYSRQGGYNSSGYSDYNIQDGNRDQRGGRSRGGYDRGGRDRYSDTSYRARPDRRQY